MAKNQDQTAQYINIAIVAVVVLIIGWMWYSAANPKTSTDNTDQTTASKAYSEDDPAKPFKSLSYEEGLAKLTAKDGKQMFYIGCRDCGYCRELETTMADFLNNYQDKNQNRDLIYKIEAGYTCVPEVGSEQREGYEKIYQFLVDNKIVEANDQKGFGTPQFIYVEGGKVKGELGERSVAGLEKFFKDHKYRI